MTKIKNMPWLDNLRNKSRGEKVKIIWLIVIISVLVLFLLWILTSKIADSRPKDTTLFKTLGRGIKDIRENFRK